MSMLCLMAAALTLAQSGPNEGQKRLIERGYGMFIHFGINTFNQTEWSDGKLPVSSYHPTHLDPDQWIKTAKEAGFRHVVLTAKHHDGFCLWDSKVTTYDVGASPVKADVVSAVARACKKYGVKLGLYYSLWDRHEPTHELADPQPYVDYMKTQLTELLTNYGPVCELWFDGGWAKKVDDWRLPEVYALIKRLQPDCQVTVNHTITRGPERTQILLPELAQTGDPIRYWPVDFRTKDPNLVRADDPKEYTAPDGQLRYLPFEHTVCLSDLGNWFQKLDERPVRTVDELEDLFYWCTAQDNVLLLNVPPDQTGRLRENERQAIFAVADRLGIRGGRKPLPRGPVDQALGTHAEADSEWDSDYDAAKAVDGRLEGTRLAAKAKTAAITLTPAKPFLFDRVVLNEFAETTDLGDGFSIARKYRTQKFAIDARQQGRWTTIHEGTTIGAAKIFRWRNVQTADALRVRILEATDAPSLYRIAVSDSRTRKTR